MKKKFWFIILIILWNLASNYAHPVTPTFFQSLHLNDAMFGYAFAAMSLGMFLSSPFWGKMTTVINSKTALAIGSFGYGLCQIIFVSAHSAWLILLARLLAGLCTSAFFVGSLTYIANMSSVHDRGANLTLNATIQVVAGAAGYFIGGMLGEISFKTSFLVQIIQLMITGIGFGLLLDRDLTSRSSMHEVFAQSNPFKAFVSAKEFMNKNFAWLFVMITLVFLGYTSFDQSLNYYIKDVFHLTSAYNGIMKGAVGLISFVLNMSLGLYLMSHTSMKTSNAALVGGSCVVLFLFMMMHTPLSSIGVAVVFYGLYAMLVPIEQNMITRHAESETRNLVLGFYQAIKSLGMILGAYLAGVMYDVSNQGPFILALMAYLCALIIALMFLRRKIYE